MARQPDIAFSVEEKLWRQIGPDGIDRTGKVRPNALRVQISVTRERHGQALPGPSPYTGIAEIIVGQAVAVTHNAARVVCVDLPTNGNSGHTTLAIVATPGVIATWDDVLGVRAKLAGLMTIVRQPA
jgi:hypothetical protein